MALNILNPYFARSDSRGKITGLIQSAAGWREINRVHSLPGTIRGGHYHLHTDELFIILRGTVEVTCRSGADAPPETAVFHAGDVFIITSGTGHTFKALEESEWLNALSVPFDPDAPDMHCC